MNVVRVVVNPFFTMTISIAYIKGKTWKNRFFTQSIGRIPYEYEAVYEVQSFETVSTKAGAFESFKIKRTSYVVECPQHLYIYYYWYSPKVKIIIKVNSIYHGDMELLNYTPGTASYEQDIPLKQNIPQDESLPGSDM